MVGSLIGDVQEFDHLIVVGSIIQSEGMGQEQDSNENQQY